MKKNTLLSLLTVSILFALLAGCSNSKHLVYFQDLKDTNFVHLVKVYPYQLLTLQPDDELRITVSSTSQEASKYFNLDAASNLYQVSQKGNITLPVLGDIKAAGLTTEQLKVLIGKSLASYLKDAVVTVRLNNFKVTVMGEVNGPGVTQITGERYTVLDAIAAHDITQYGKRYNIKVMRNVAGNMEVAHLNFNTSDVFKSPYFQMHQNDIIYVEPLKTKALPTEKFNLFLPIFSTALGFISFILAFALK